MFLEALLTMKGFVLAAAASAAFGLAVVSGMGCIWHRLFGIICPGCGMTRAVVALINGDITAAFYYHPMVWSLPIIIIYIAADGRVFKNKMINYGITAVIAAGFAINYIIRLF